MLPPTNRHAIYSFCCAFCSVLLRPPALTQCCRRFIGRRRSLQAPHRRSGHHQTGADWPHDHLPFFHPEPTRRSHQHHCRFGLLGALGHSYRCKSTCCYARIALLANCVTRRNSSAVFLPQTPRSTLVFWRSHIPSSSAGGHYSRATNCTMKSTTSLLPLASLLSSC